MLVPPETFARTCAIRLPRNAACPISAQRSMANGQPVYLSPHFKASIETIRTRRFSLLAVKPVCSQRCFRTDSGF